MATSAWHVSRKGEEVRVQVTDAATFEESDAGPVIGAVEKHLTEDHVRTVRFSGPVLGASRVPNALMVAILYMAKLAQRRGMRLHVGSI
jgi:hypothetical protein